MTLQKFLDEVSIFAEEFKKLVDENEDEDEDKDEDFVPKTPQADAGIGVPSYEFGIKRGTVVSPSNIDMLNGLVRDQQKIGNILLRSMATITWAVFNIEAPINWLPALQRSAIRTMLHR